MSIDYDERMNELKQKALAMKSKNEADTARWLEKSTSAKAGLAARRKGVAQALTDIDTAADKQPGLIRDAGVAGQASLRRRAAQSLASAFGGSAAKSGAVASGATLAGMRGVAGELGMQEATFGADVAQQAGKAELSAAAQKYETETMREQIASSDADKAKLDQQAAMKQINSIENAHSGLGQSGAGVDKLKRLLDQWVDSPAYTEIADAIRAAIRRVK